MHWVYATSTYIPKRAQREATDALHYTTMKSVLYNCYTRKSSWFMAATCHVIIFSAFINKCCIGSVVYPRLLEGRDDNGQLVLHIHEGLTLNLEKSSVLAKNFQYVSSATDSHTNILDGGELEKNLYHDTARTSSLIVDRTSEGLLVRGILTHRFAIAPLELSSRSAEGNIAHEVTEIKNSSTPTSDEDADESMETDDVLQCDTKYFGNRTTNPNEYDEFVAEICVVTTISYREAFNTSEDLVEYMAALTNAVQLRFTSMRDPRISFQLNELRVVEDDRVLGTPTCHGSNGTEEADVDPVGCGIDVEAALNKSTEYINECLPANCDIVYVIISADLMYTVNGTVNADVQGMTEIGGVCTSQNVAIGEDTPKGFTGLITMAHEIGHLLGSDHDGCPGAENCSLENGNLMSYMHRGTKNKSILSECTNQQISFLLRRLPDSCISVSTAASYRNMLYPGQNVTEEEMCKLIYPDKNASVFREEDMLPCELLCCWKTFGSSSQEISDNLMEEDEESPETTDEYDDGDTTEEYADISEIPTCRYHHMLDGMRCGPTKTCYKGICGNHSWDEIQRKYGTNRTFDDLVTDWTP